MIGTSKSILTGSTFHRCALLAAGLALSVGLAAQKVAAQTQSSGSSLGLKDASASYSFSSDGDVERNGKIGSVQISHFEFDASASLPGPATWRFSSGIYWSHDDFKLTGNVPLPEKLDALGISFTATKDLANEFGAGWSATAMLRPSFYSDSADVSGDSFNLLSMVGVGKEVSPTLSWNLGVGTTTRGKHKVLPVVGVRWNFAPDWTLSVGFPRTGINYKFSDALDLRVGMTFQGGNYHISKAPAAGLGDTYLEYREIRVGLGAAYKVSKSLSVEVDGGTTVNRTFDYFERNVKLDGKSAAYGRLSLRYRF